MKGKGLATKILYLWVVDFNMFKSIYGIEVGCCEF